MHQKHLRNQILERWTSRPDPAGLHEWTHNIIGHRPGAHLWLVPPSTASLASPVGVVVPHTDMHEGVAHKAVTVGWVVRETLAQVGVGEIVRRRVLDCVDHEERLPQHVGVGRLHVAVDGVLHLGAEVTGRGGGEGRKGESGASATTPLTSPVLNLHSLWACGFLACSSGCLLGLKTRAGTHLNSSPNLLLR